MYDSEVFYYYEMKKYFLTTATFRGIYFRLFSVCNRKWRDKIWYFLKSWINWMCFFTFVILVILKALQSTAIRAKHLTKIQIKPHQDKIKCWPINDQIFIWSAYKQLNMIQKDDFMIINTTNGPFCILYYVYFSTFIANIFSKLQLF